MRKGCRLSQTCALPIEKLRKRLENLWPPHERTKSENDEVITAVTAVVDRTSDLRAWSGEIPGKGGRDRGARRSATSTGRVPGR